MSKTIIVSNQKGGVLKTTTVRNLSYILAEKGYKVLCIDFDQQGSLTTSFGYKPYMLKNNIATLMERFIKKEYIDCIDDYIIKKGKVDILPSNTTLSVIEQLLVTATSREYILKKIIRIVKDNYDFILVDCSPNLGILNINALTCADYVIVPIKAQHLDSIGFTMLYDSIKLVREETNPNIKIGGYFFTMFDERLNLAKQTEIDVKIQCELMLFEEMASQKGIKETFDYYNSNNVDYNDNDNGIDKEKVEKYYYSLVSAYGETVTKILDEIRKKPINGFQTKISTATKSAESCKYGLSVFEHAKDCKVANEYENLCMEVLNIV